MGSSSARCLCDQVAINVDWSRTSASRSWRSASRAKTPASCWSLPRATASVSATFGVPMSHLLQAHCGVLEVRLSADCIPAGDRQLICRTVVLARAGAITVDVPVAVVERDEHHPRLDLAYTRGQHE